MSTLTLTKQPALSLAKAPYFKRTPRVMAGTAQRLVPEPLLLLGALESAVYLVPNGGWYTVRNAANHTFICELSADSELDMWLWQRGNRSEWATGRDIALYILSSLAN